MAIETEKKYRLNGRQREQVIVALKESGAEYKGEDFEENVIYGGGILDEKRAVLRVRKTQGKTVLAFKQRVQNQDSVKQQIEHETVVASAAAAQSIVESLGFVRRLVYEKRRETWKLRQVEVVIDELPFGHYMEIEGAAAAIAEAEALLGIEDFAVEDETYPRLTAKFGARNGDLIEARFA